MRTFRGCCCGQPTPCLLGGGGSPFLLLYGGSPPASPASHLAGLLQKQPTSGSTWPACPKNGKNGPPLRGAGGVSHSHT